MYISYKGAFYSQTNGLDGVPTLIYDAFVLVVKLDKRV